MCNVCTWRGFMLYPTYMLVSFCLSLQQCFHSSTRALLTYCLNTLLMVLPKKWVLILDGQSLKKINRPTLNIVYSLPLYKPLFTTMYVFNKWATKCDFQQCSTLTSVDSDEPVQSPFKLRTSKWCSVSSLTLMAYSSGKPDSDQTARMRRLRWGFAGRTYHIVGKSHAMIEIRLTWFMLKLHFLMPWLKYKIVIRLNLNYVTVTLFPYLQNECMQFDWKCVRC